MNYDVIVIGGGPAGLASALEAKKTGASVLILERNSTLGGILQQCIHNGFGLHYFKEELTGPEYASRFVKLVRDSDIDYLLETMVIEVTKDKKVIAISPTKGYLELQAKSIVLAMGCRERTAGAIALLGTRPSGVYTAGSAQRLLNLDGYLVGKKVVILGSGDIGLIMARRMTFEGAKVLEVLELMPYSSGLKRNIVQCLEDYNIPLHYKTTVTRLVGKNKLTGLFVAPVDDKNIPILAEERFVECDTLLLSVGLLPETDLVSSLDISWDRVTGGAIVDENRETSLDGFFACGNVLHVHDLVDNVSEEGAIAGKFAGLYALQTMEAKAKEKLLSVLATGGVRYALPQKMMPGVGKVKIYFRVDKVYKNAKKVVKCGDKVIYSQKTMVMAPGEMESISLDKELITEDLVVSLEV